MKYITTAKMKELDRRAIEECGIPSLILMENAGRGIAELAQAIFKKKNFEVLVICGRGNNGGDGLVAARHLANAGFSVQIVLLGNPDELKGDPKINFAIVQKMRIPVAIVEMVRTLNESGVIPARLPARQASIKRESVMDPRQKHAGMTKASMSEVRKLIDSADLIVDAIFGIGLTRAVEGVFRDVIELVNASGKKVLSVDIPSGLNSDSGEVLGVAVRAGVTGTLAFPKRGLKTGAGPKHAGKIKVLDISIPRGLSSRQK